MNRGKFVMGIFALAAVLAMCSIGYSVAASSVFGIIAGIVATCVIFMTAFKLKRKLREQGLL
ncbi:DUF5325 family protein [Lysinibacillus xylanilyticus]|uniref:DUF5325 family protein n=1 Tax=Lysinibacillus xylanilyticus TaxID=582475 RepID=UPI003CFD2D9F